MRARAVTGITILAVAALTLTACATQPPPSAYDPPGFFSGLLHGLILPFSLFGSLFTDYRIYAFPNSGWWYDLGFTIGVFGVFGGGSAAAR